MRTANRGFVVLFGVAIQVVACGDVGDSSTSPDENRDGQGGARSEGSLGTGRGTAGGTATGTSSMPTGSGGGPAATTTSSTTEPSGGCVASYCTGNTLHFCDGGQMSAYECTDAGCQQAGYGKLIGCGPDDSGSAKCMCEGPKPKDVCKTGDSECTGPNEGHDCIAGQWGSVISCDDFCKDVTAYWCLNGKCDTSLSCEQVGNTAQCGCVSSCQQFPINATSCNAADPGNALFCASWAGKKVWATANCFDVCLKSGFSGTFGCGPVPGGGNYCQCY